MVIRLLRVILFISLLSGIAFAQQVEPASAVGLPTTVFNGTEIEHVDLMSGALQVSIPLISEPGRGIDTNIALSYSSKIWSTQLATVQIEDGISATAAIENTSGGGQGITEPNALLWGRISTNWFLGFPKMGYLQGRQTVYLDQDQDWTLYTETWQNYDGSVLGLIQSNGVFYTGDENTCPDFCGLPPNRYCLMSTGGQCAFGPYWANDNSYTLSTFNNSNSSPRYVNLYKNGTFASIATNNTATSPFDSIATLTDTNGNQVNCETATCTDTVGRIFVLSQDANYMVSTLNYLDSNGQSQNINISYQSFTLNYPYPDACTLSGNYADGCVYVVSGTGWLPVSLTLPGGATYQFSYLISSDGSTTGELTKLTLPAGGYVRYQYGYGPPEQYPVVCSSTNINCTLRGENRIVTDRYVSPDGSAASEQHWAYSIRQPYQLTSGPNAGAVAVASTVTKPASQGQEVDVFQDGDYLAESLVPAVPQLLQVKEMDASGNVLRLTENVPAYDNTTYNIIGLTSNGALLFQSNNPRVSTETVTLMDTGQKSTTAFSYGTYGNVTGKTQYDWSANGNDIVLSRTANTFLVDSTPAYSDAQIHILDRVASTTIYDSSSDTCNGINAPCSSTLYGYDGYSLQVTSGAASHDYVNYSFDSSTLRGNQTVVERILATPSAQLFTYKYYDDLGNVVRTRDPLANWTYYSYTDAFNNFTPTNPTYAYATQVTLPLTGTTSHIRNYQYYFNGGKVAAICGENFPAGAVCQQGLYTIKPDYGSFSYEALNRIHCKFVGDGGSTCLTYNDTNIPLSATQTVAENSVSGSNGIVSGAIFDGLGRKVQTVLTSDPYGSIQATTSYDTVGRVSTTSNPYRSLNDSTYGILTSNYDALSRKLSEVHSADNSSLSWQYTGSLIDSWDEAGVHWKRNYDALGRLKQVFELGTSASPINLETDYAYDALGNIQSVAQKGNGSTDASRLRSFTYDSLSRLVCASNPEDSLNACPTSPLAGLPSLATTYIYDLNGNLHSKSNARGVSTSYSYDALNRLLSKSFTGMSALSSCYAYDIGLNSSSVSNSEGRLVAEWTQPGNCPSNPTILPANAVNWKTITTYDPMGRVKLESQCAFTPCSSPNQLQYIYDLAGNLTSSTNGLPIPTSGSLNPVAPGIVATSAYDSAGRLSQLVSNWTDITHPSTLFEADTPINGVQPYGPIGLQAAQYGVSSQGVQALLETRAYDNRERLIGKTILGQSYSTLPQPTVTLQINPYTTFTTANIPAAIVQVSCNSACGSVDFKVDGNEWGTPVLGSNGVYVAEISTAPSWTLAPGTHYLTVYYLGSSAFAPATSNTVAYTVTAMGTTSTAATLSMNPTITTFTLEDLPTAGIKVNCSPSCGWADFKVDGNEWGTVFLHSDGTYGADLSTAPNWVLAAGATHQLTVYYLGDSTYAPATSNTIAYTVTDVGTTPPTVNLTIDPTTTTFSAANPPNVNVSVGCGTVCGMVDFKVDGIEWGTQWLSSSGTYNVSMLNAPGAFLQLGTHTLTVNFLGGSLDAPAAATPIQYTVTNIGTTPSTVTASLSPSATTFTSADLPLVIATVNCASDCGLVDYTVDGYEWGIPYLKTDGTYTAILQDAPAFALTPGIHQLTIYYLGSSTYAPSTSLPITYTVSQ